MPIGIPVEVRSPVFSNSLRIWSERIRRIHPLARTNPAKRGTTLPKSPLAVIRTPGKPMKSSDYPSLPSRSFDWLSLDELIVEAKQRGLLTREEWDGTRYRMTVLGERFSFTPKQARAFLFGAIAGQRARAYYADAEGENQ